MQDIDLLISPRFIVPIRPENTYLEGHSIAIDQGKIIALVETAQALSEYSPKTHKELPSHVIMPGLINAHTHSPMSLYRGLADDLNLMDWLNNHIWPAEAALTNEESIQDGMQLAIAEMLRGGTTCFNEMYFFPNETAQVTAQAGMRACIGHTVMNVPTGWAKDENEYIAKAKEAYKNRVKDELITWSVAPQGPYTNSDTSLKLAIELADEFGFVMNMHIHETQAEIDMSLEEHSKRPIKRLQDLNFFNEKTIAVHMVHLTNEEIAFMADKKVSIAHCPVSNLKLASGFAPIKELMDAGVNVAIGTDGAASNNSLDLFAELKTAAITSKAVSQDPTALPAHQALEMATINGAKALHLDDKIGSLEVGKLADIIAVDLGHFITEPVYNPISHLVYAVNRLQVSDVWVNGKQVVKDTNLQTLDTASVIAKAEKWRQQALQFSTVAPA